MTQVSDIDRLKFSVSFSVYAALRLSGAISRVLMSPNDLSDNEKVNLLIFANGLTRKSLEMIRNDDQAS